MEVFFLGGGGGGVVSCSALRGFSNEAYCQGGGKSR